MAKAKQAVGLDIGTDAVRVAVVRSGPTPTLVRLGQVMLPPGAVVDGQVVEPGEVAGAIRQLLKENDIDDRGMHIGAPQSRAIVRTVEVADLPEADLRSAVGFELEEHLPLAAVDAAYDVLPLDRIEVEDGWRRRVALAAAPLDAVRPSVAAVEQAGRRVLSINVAPLPLARLFPPVGIHDYDGTSRASVDLIVSIGSATMTVLVTAAGALLFNRTTSSPIGARLTDGIEEQLAVGRDVAELAKRRVVNDDNRHLVAMATALSDLKVSELLDEVQDSLDYYRSQAFARPIDRIIVTGGGALMPGLDFHLADRFAVPAQVGDPYQRVSVSLPKMPPEQRLNLAPFVSTALAYALDAAATIPRFDLSPPTAKTAEAGPGRSILLALGLVTVAGVGGLTWMARSEASDIRSNVAAVQSDLDAAQARLTKLEAETAGSLTKGEMKGIADAALATQIDWVAVVAQIEAIGGPIGVTLDDFQAVTPVGTRPLGINVPVIGSVSMGGVAPTLKAVADWIAMVEADGRYIAVAAPSTSADGAIGYRFQASVFITESNLLHPPADPATAPAAGAAVDPAASADPASSTVVTDSTVPNSVVTP